jgi:hypothetical protein
LNCKHVHLHIQVFLRQLQQKCDWHAYYYYGGLDELH